MNNVTCASLKMVVLSGMLLFVTSCSKDLEEANQGSQQTVSKTEVKTILETDEFSSAADGVVTELFQQGASGKSANNEDCYDAEYSETGFTVNFDNCTVEEGGETLRGLLTVTYEAGEESNEFTATYSDLSVDNIIINGTRSFTVNNNNEGDDVSFTIVSDMNIELADGSLIQEVGTKTFRFEFDFENFENSALVIDGNWTVVADGNTYNVNVSSDLIGNFGCEHVGSGVMTLDKNGLAVVVDFGDGTCDDMANLTYPDGTVEEISLKD